MLNNATRACRERQRCGRVRAGLPVSRGSCRQRSKPRRRARHVASRPIRSPTERSIRASRRRGRDERPASQSWYRARARTCSSGPGQPGDHDTASQRQRFAHRSQSPAIARSADLPISRSIPLTDRMSGSRRFTDPTGCRHGGAGRSAHNVSGNSGTTESMLPQPEPVLAPTGSQVYPDAFQ